MEKAQAIKIQWHLCAGGVCSTPDWSIREGRTFMEAVNGRIICTLPETTTKTSEQVGKDAKLLFAAPDMLEALRLALPCIEYAEIATAAEGQTESHKKCLTALELTRGALAKAGGAE